MLEDFEVAGMNIEKGTFEYNDHSPVEQISGGRILFVGYEFLSSLQWVAANLSCLEAQLDTSGYACVSINSRCVGVNATIDYRFSEATKEDTYVGYRCKCTDGFKGNPYIQNGCRGTLYLSHTCTHALHIMYITISISYGIYLVDCFWLPLHACRAYKITFIIH